MYVTDIKDLWNSRLGIVLVWNVRLYKCTNNWYCVGRRNVGGREGEMVVIVDKNKCA